MSKGPWTVRQFAAKLGISEKRVLQLIQRQRVVGASKHPLTKKWLIHPPAKVLLCAKGPWT